MRDAVERSANAAGGRDFHARAGKDCRHQPFGRRLAINLRGDQAGEQPCPLIVADQDDTTPLIVVVDIALPCGLHIGIGHLAIAARIFAGEHLAQGRERHLAIDGRIDAADGTEARDLLARDLLFLRPDIAVGVGGLVARDGWIDIEAVDCGIGCRLEVVLGQLAVSSDDGGSCDLLASVRLVRTAEP